MTTDVMAATSEVPLVELLRAARLPSPAERQAIRERAGATLREVGKEIARHTEDGKAVSATTVLRWERGEHGKGPSRTHAIAYRRVLDALREAS